MIDGLSACWLSKGGKEILITSIAILPNYVTSNFLLPLDIYKNQASAIARFLWSLNSPKIGMHWKKWENNCSKNRKVDLVFV